MEILRVSQSLRACSSALERFVGLESLAGEAIGVSSKILVWGSKSFRGDRMGFCGEY